MTLQCSYKSLLPETWTRHYRVFFSSISLSPFRIHNSVRLLFKIVNNRYVNSRSCWRKLHVGKIEYEIGGMREITTRELVFKDHLVRCVSFAFLFSAVSWVMRMPDAGILFFVFGIFAAKKFELIATFRAVDETGDQSTTIAKSNDPKDYDLYKEISNYVSACIHH